MLADLLLVTHAASVLFLAGLAWTVSVVVYPGFAAVGPTSAWPAFHAAHSRRITSVVGPPWAVQGLTVLGLLVARPDGVPLWLVLLAGAAAAGTVACTAAGAVPVHARLGNGYSAQLHRRLRRADAWRTAAWSAAAVCAIAMLLLAGQG